MIGQIISHYKILEKLGGGGMGVVYKAQDLKLERFVALKFLPPHLDANEDEKKRFIQEAKAASALDHPNICTIYEIDETADGQLFIAMAYYDGETLKARVAKSEERKVRGEERRVKGEEPGAPITPRPSPFAHRPSPFTVAEAIGLAVQISQGLAKAHEHGIVHRDIKPANIIVTKDGVVKIIDFGLAKFVGRHTLTKSGATMGTMAYMAPEQVSGGSVDQRADVWSLGVVLYEMLTGQPPFQGENEQAVMYAILCKEPPPLTGLPEELEALVRRAVEKDVHDRYQHINEVLEPLRRFQNQTATHHVEKRRHTSPASFKNRIYLYGGILAVLLIFGLFGVFTASSSIDSLAVLPFANADPNTEYLSDGMSESLTQSLSRLSHLKVRSFNVAARYKGKDKTLQEIGRELEAKAVLIGRVTQRGDVLSISAELVETQDNRHIWGERYERKLNELLLVQDEIAAAVANNLQPDLTGEEKQRLTTRSTRNFEAYQLYLKGRYYTAKYNKEGYEKGLAYFRQAVLKDPNYALAYDGLAYYYCSSFEWMMSPKEALPQAKEAALKALALDETLAEAHASLGAVYFYDWDWPAAEREFQRAIQLNPNYAMTYTYYAQYLLAKGRIDEALALAKRGYEIEPLSLESNTFLGWHYILAGQNDLAMAQLNNALEMDPNFWFARLMLAGVYAIQGRHEEACAEYEKAHALEGEFSEALANLGQYYAQQGKIEAARKILLELKQRAEAAYVPPYFFFMIHHALGEKDEALPWFEAAFEQRCIYLLWDKVFAYADYQRSDPRLAAILDKVGVKEELK